MLSWLSAPRAVDAVKPTDYDTLEEIHAVSFPAHWSADEQAAMASGPGVATFVARRGSATASRRPVGFITVRRAADEGEVLTMAVHPRHRRAGVGRLLLDHALDHFRQAQVVDVFLEVDPLNTAAISLYRGAGFEVVGERPDYYGGADGPRKALTMRLHLAPVPPRPDVA